MNEINRMGKEARKYLKDIRQTEQGRKVADTVDKIFQLKREGCTAVECKSSDGKTKFTISFGN